jgi:eukaryotic-like serine/threonine-protein kinase
MKSGDVLSRKYRLEQEIGKGAMGAVWAAYDHTSNRRVALKAILPQSREQLTNDLRQRLLREARACGKLSHRHIVQIFDVGETPEGEPFIILELLHGQTLGDRLKEKRRIEPALAARIAGEIASGLAVAHAAQVIHRDLKPANIFLHREEGTPEDMFVSKILDFGVCKNLDSSESVATQTGIAVGSPAYMSPEQVGMRKDIDHRTDLWSLGIVLFEMLTGARPFTGAVQDVIRNILLTPVPPPSSKVREVPPELDAIVARCTAGKREDRYASADELASALFAVARTVRPMTRKATFTGVGPAPSAQQSPSADRPASFTPPSLSAPSLIATPHAAIDSTPPGYDESDTAATLPLQGRMLMDLRQSVPQVGRRESAPTGTEIMQPTETLASPAPAWNKNEMKQALAAHRQSHSSVDVVMPEQAASGYTQAVTDSQIQQVPGIDPTGTTSNAGALSHRTSGYPTPPPPLMAMDPAITTGRRKQTKKVLLAVMGAGIVAAIGVFGLIMISLGRFELESSASVNEAKPEGSPAAATPKAPEAGAQVITSPTTTAVAPTATPAPPDTAPPAVAAPTPPPPAPTPTVQAPTPKPTAQAPTPKPTMKGQPNPFVDPTPKPTNQATQSPLFEVPTKAPAQKPSLLPKPKCTGTGLDKKCK